MGFFIAHELQPKILNLLGDREIIGGADEVCGGGLVIGDGCGGGELDGEVVVVVDGGTAEGDEPGDGDMVAI